jgi:hypothetical protein
LHSATHLKAIPVPPGHAIIERDLSVAGLAHHKVHAARFCEGQNQAVELVPDPQNAHDANAIQVWGTWTDIDGAHGELLGFVWREEAAKIARAGIVGAIQGRLYKTFLEDDYVSIRFQITAPKEAAAIYKATR